jgi:L-threonylcarbamoyladenylate synthase
MPGHKTRHLGVDSAGCAEAGALLRSGKLVAFPTETVYGLGADATNAIAVAGIYEAKGRPRFNPLIIHVSGVEDAVKHGVFSPLAEELAHHFWPGPLTLVVPLREGAPISDLALAGHSSIALRVPSNPVARAIIAASGRPIAAPSANRSGHVSPTLAEHVLEDLDGRIDAVVMGGPADVGVESTILSLLDERAVLLRPGGVTRADLASVLGYEPELMEHSSDEYAPLAPGLLKSHYAPKASLRLEAHSIREDEAALLFGTFRPQCLEKARQSLNLSPRGDLKEAAASLFSALRQLDHSGASVIAVAPIPDFGLGEALKDRLQRAAAPRPSGET